MKLFLWKGLIRDKGRSLFPVLVVSIGVFFVVLLDGMIGGMIFDLIKMTANFQTGHLKVVTNIANDNDNDITLEYALTDVYKTTELLDSVYKDIDWFARIYFSGLIDISSGNKQLQGPVIGKGYNLLNSPYETERLGLKNALINGKLISKSNEVLISIDFSNKYNIEPGDTITFMGNTMFSSMTFTNLIVCGVLKFGNFLLDRGTIILDISDAREILDMEDAASEIVGYSKKDNYDDTLMESIKENFNHKYSSNDDFAATMLQLADQNYMRSTLEYYDSLMDLMIVIMIITLFIVLWNSGVLGGVRRYNEFGVRLALGESNNMIYRSLLFESLVIGVIGSAIGTLIGIIVSLLIKKYGIDYGSAMENVSMLMEPVLRSQVKIRMYYIGFIPGVLAMLSGSVLSGIAIYKRKTSSLLNDIN